MAETPGSGRPTAAERALRLECLKLALVRGGAADARPWRAIADEFHAWVAGEGEGPADPPAAAPRADRAQTRGQARADGRGSVPQSGRTAGPRRKPA